MLQDNFFHLLLCRWVFERKMPSAVGTITEVYKAVQEMQSSGSSRPNGRSNQDNRTRQPDRWVRPEVGTVKINCDAAWCPSTHRGGLSVIARDHSGAICGGRQMPIIGGSVEELEALAIVEGMILATESGWRDIVVESDSEVVINHLKGIKFSWRIEAILPRVRTMATSCATIRWVAILRNANKCTDFVARLAHLGVCPMDWADRPPPELSHLLVFYLSM